MLLSSIVIMLLNSWLLCYANNLQQRGWSLPNSTKGMWAGWGILSVCIFVFRLISSGFDALKKMGEIGIFSYFGEVALPAAGIILFFVIIHVFRTKKLWS